MFTGQIFDKCCCTEREKRNTFYYSKVNRNTPLLQSIPFAKSMMRQISFGLKSHKTEKNIDLRKMISGFLCSSRWVVCRWWARSGPKLWNPREPGSPAGTREPEPRLWAVGASGLRRQQWWSWGRFRWGGESYSLPLCNCRQLTCWVRTGTGWSSAIKVAPQLVSAVLDEVSEQKKETLHAKKTLIHKSHAKKDLTKCRVPIHGQPATRSDSLGQALKCQIWTDLAMCHLTGLASWC